MDETAKIMVGGREGTHTADDQMGHAN